MQPRVTYGALLTALATAAACCPRLVLWPGRPAPLWVLAGVVLGTSFVLWAFVWGWHTEYAGRPVLAKLERRDWALASGGGAGVALFLLVTIDPVFRALTPEDYPTSFRAWTAMTLFGLSFESLFLCFAPFAFFVRLCQAPRAAAVLTVLWGLCVMYLKIDSSHTPLSPGLTAGLTLVRLGVASLSVFFYLRGGLWLALYWMFWLHARHLLMFLAQE